MSHDLTRQLLFRYYSEPLIDAMLATTDGYPDLRATAMRCHADHLQYVAWVKRAKTLNGPALLTRVLSHRDNRRSGYLRDVARALQTCLDEGASNVTWGKKECYRALCHPHNEELGDAATLQKFSSLWQALHSTNFHGRRDQLIKSGDEQTCTNIVSMLSSARHIHNASCGHTCTGASCSDEWHETDFRENACAHVAYAFSKLLNQSTSSTDGPKCTPSTQHLCDDYDSAMRLILQPPDR